MTAPTVSKETTREPQYQREIELRDQFGLTSFGLMSNQVWQDDPKRLTFLLARYKFAAKMLDGFGEVLEVGCADAFGTRVVQQHVKRVTAIDFDPTFVRDVNQRMSPEWKFECFEHDMLRGPVPGTFDGAYSMDVLEHIPKESEDLFLRHISLSLKEDGVLVVGSPSLQSQVYASVGSKAGHVNCKDGTDFKNTLRRHFHNVFLFSMNDEVVHTGFSAMAHYLIGLCVRPLARTA